MSIRSRNNNGPVNADNKVAFHEDFVNLADVFSRKGRDTAVEEMVDKLYHFVMSLPFPEKWLHQALQDMRYRKRKNFPIIL